MGALTETGGAGIVNEGCLGWVGGSVDGGAAGGVEVDGAGAGAGRDTVLATGVAAGEAFVWLATLAGTRRSSADVES